MSENEFRPGILCISTYEKGQAFLKEAARLGATVTLLTVDKLRDADWPRESLAELLTMPSGLTPQQVLNTVCYLARGRRFDRIVALDEFDLETAALLREHMRLPGMGETATRFFRDKLAMRVRARDAGIAVPEFTGVFNYDDVRAYMASVPGPWLLKPRTNASAIGIEPIDDPEQLWRLLDTLGDLQTHYVLERFVAGEVYHVEGVSWKGELLFSAPHKYGHPPMQTMHKGGVFTTRSLHPDSHDAEGTGHGLRRDPYGVHQVARGREVLLPRNGGAGWRSVHRGAGGVFEGGKSVGGVGAGRGGECARHGVLPAQAAVGLCG
jgi:hypothetical protein